APLARRRSENFLSCNGFSLAKLHGLDLARQRIVASCLFRSGGGGRL
ncbi:hypothetical protein EVAR_21888_1, partial [Eumeta japonica]